MTQSFELSRKNRALSSSAADHFSTVAHAYSNPFELLGMEICHPSTLHTGTVPVDSLAVFDMSFGTSSHRLSVSRQGKVTADISKFRVRCVRRTRMHRYTLVCFSWTSLRKVRIKRLILVRIARCNKSQVSLITSLRCNDVGIPFKL